MLTKEFSYTLPEELVAKNPVSPRDASKLMVLHRNSKEIEHRIFFELSELLSSDYVLVLNNTRVFAARLLAKIRDKQCEVLLIKEREPLVWQCMVKPGKKFIAGETVVIEGKNEQIEALVMQINDDGTRELKFNINGDFSEWLERNGYPPFPPYIKNSTADFDDYQTIYAEDAGSIAAPTAGLHFTNEVFSKLKEKNIEICYVTLHVGRGTFLPVKTEHLEDHVMHTEWYQMTKECANRLNKAKKQGKKILAVGTTSVRVLESNFIEGAFHPESRETDIFIYPGYEFKAVDALLTNFHLPESTLIMLVSAFAGKDVILEAYQEAINQKYRFYSFGDAMLIL